MLELPTNIQLEITDLCNLRCRYCYHFDTDNMPLSKDLDDDHLLKLSEMIADCKPYSLVITGGEPFVRADMVFRLIPIFRESCSFVSINTNLLLLKEDEIKKLCDINIGSLLVSCPASDPVFYREMTKCGNFDILKKNLKLVLDYGISCMVNMVVTPANTHLIRSTAMDLSKLGVKRFAATPASLNVEHPNFNDLLNREQTIALLEDLRWCSEELGLQVDILEPIVKCFLPDWCWEKDYAFIKRACQAGRMSVSIANNGDVRPCSHNPIIFGNMFLDDLQSIWSRMDVCRSESVPKFCQNCPSVVLCNGGCRTNSLAMHKSLYEQDRFMTGHKPLTDKSQRELLIKDDSIIGFNGKLTWRSEFQNYSVSSKAGGANLMIVNEEMFSFINWLEQNLPLSLSSIKRIINMNNSDDFLKIINLLIAKSFIIVVN